MPRYWAGVDIDIRKKLKLVSLAAYDKNLPTISELFSFDSDDLEQTNIHLDVGFIYAYNENFRFGVHLTSPFLAFYWKI